MQAERRRPGSDQGGAADRNIVASVSHYCSVAAIAAVETYNRLGLPMVVWGAVLPDITYRNKFPEVHRLTGP